MELYLVLEDEMEDLGEQLDYEGSEWDTDKVSYIGRPVFVDDLLDQWSIGCAEVRVDGFLTGETPDGVIH
ncbi:MAG: hypothetical protein M5R36_28980 [Deltaproteobacteria bacterium]|nr:hypothetical protein [Deltaproteobacteria bacterium]